MLSTLCEHSLPLLASPFAGIFSDKIMSSRLLLLGGVPVGLGCAWLVSASSTTVFLITSLLVTWMVFKFIRNLKLDDPDTTLEMKMKPMDYRGYHNNDDDEDIPEDVRRKYERDIANFMSYDPMCTKAIVNFQTIKMNTECIFAKNSKLWGSCDYNEQLSLEENVKRSIPMFMKFSAICAMKGLDGFVFELPGGKFRCSTDDFDEGEHPEFEVPIQTEQFNSTLEQFGESVRRVLTVLSDHDPVGYHCMNKSFIGKRGWCFEFNRQTFFITTFSSLYPDSHARYAFGATGNFILFQPEISFALHNIPKDTPDTNWDNPKSVRDRIRVAYKENGREYLIRDTVVYPVAYDIVKPLKIKDPVIEWWNTRTDVLKKSDSVTENNSKCPFMH
ncbi:uncharacterized protein LOC144451610 [Glandiceps talaboti]